MVSDWLDNKPRPITNWQWRGINAGIVTSSDPEKWKFEISHKLSGRRGQSFATAPNIYYFHILLHSALPTSQLAISEITLVLKYHQSSSTINLIPMTASAILQIQ